MMRSAFTWQRAELQAAQYTPQWRLGVGYEFEQRPDGLPGLSSAYGLKFAGAPRTMDLGLLYSRPHCTPESRHDCRRISTDGPIQALGLTVLEDDRHYFPPYQAVPLVRDEALRKMATDSKNALSALAGKISAEGYA